MKKATKYFIFLLLIPLGSCRHRLKAVEYMKYVQNTDNGLKKVIQSDGWEFIMQYKPYDYVLLLEKNANKGSEIENRKNDLKGTAWFNISIQRMDGSITPLRYGITNLDEYNQRLDYFLNHAKEDILLIYDNDTLKPSAYLFENNYNLTPQETVVVGFTLPANQDYPQKDMQLSFTDQVFKNGIIKTKYSREVLQNIPNAIF